jgi:hypothetical protein
MAAPVEGIAELFGLLTVNKFLNGKPVDNLNFVELSEKLGLDWKDIAELQNTDEADSDPISLPSSSEYGEGSSSPLDKVEANQSNPNRKKIRVLVEFKGSISEADKPKLVALIAQLQALAADSSLAMKIVEGNEEESEEG